MKTIRKIGSIIVLLTLTVSAVQAQESLSVFPVTNYGANGNGVAENAVSIQQAIDASAPNGTEVGYFTGPKKRFNQFSVSLTKDDVGT